MRGKTDWACLSIPHDAKRLTVRMTFLFSCVDLSPRPHRAQAIGCLGTASAHALLCFVFAVIYFLFALFTYIRCTTYKSLRNRQNTKRATGAQKLVKTDNTKERSWQTSLPGWVTRLPGVWSILAGWSTWEAGWTVKNGPTGLLGLGPWNSSQKSEVESNGL